MPQGSIINLLLFLLYVNDLPDWILSSIQMFADDMKLTVTGNGLQVRTFDVV